MKKQAKITQLKLLSDLIFDQHSAKLQACAAARGASLQRLADLRVTAQTELDPITQAQSMIRYERWADARRADINVVLARQTVDWMEARTAAKMAFGRAEILRQLQTKSKRNT